MAPPRFDFMFVDEIYDLAKTFHFSSDVISLIHHVLHDHRPQTWSGSAKSDHHHYRDNGLSEHTLEVIRLCFSTKETLKLKDVDDVELFLAALYHDVGKIHDYEKKDFNVWGPTVHKRMIHHISRSALMWSHAVESFPEVKSKYHDSVLHAILAHHGHREWGSPVSPNTKVAWILHLCDGLSARMDDWNKIDFVKK